MSVLLRPCAARSAFRERACFINHERCHLLEPLERFRISFFAK